MKGKLRAIQDRKQQHEVENDLRGLGETLQVDNTPEPVLSFQGNWSNLQKLASDLSIAPQAGDLWKGTTTHFHCHDEHLSHKQKALHLFAFGLAVNQNLNLGVHLWEFNRLRHDLQTNLHDGKSPQLHKISISQGISLDSSVQLHLHQSGFPINPQSENLTLSKEITKNCWNQFQKSTGQSLRKVV